MSTDPAPPQRPDAVTELLLAEAGRPARPVAVLDDEAGALTAGLQEGGVDPQVWCDDVRAEDAVPAPLRRPTPTEAVAGARTVLWRLPKSLTAVDEYAQLIAAHAAPDVRVLTAARDKHLNRSVNEVLARHFGNVRASLGRRKARALVATQPVAGVAAWPRANRLDRFGLEVVAHGAVFATNKLDRGTALLAGQIERLPDAVHAVDLGCGSGILAALLARRGHRVTGVDVTWSATDATRLTAVANGLDVAVHRADGVPVLEEPVGLIVLNPPFHDGAAKDTEPTRALLANAGAALAEGGELWCVYNAHLPYLPWLQRSVGPTKVVARDRSYLVTRSVRTTQVRPAAPIN